MKTIVVLTSQTETVRGDAIKKPKDPELNLAWKGEKSERSSGRDGALHDAFQDEGMERWVV